MAHDLDPAFVAGADQVMAAANEHLQQFVDRFREHTAEHGGEVLCPFNEAAANALDEHPIEMLRMFAAAVMRLARQETTT